MDKEKIKALQDELKARYKSLSECPVKYCGRDKADGTKAIWVELLPDLKPYPDDLDEKKSCIEALYFYYPLEDDPSLLTEEEKADKGFIRVFAYMGIPKSAESGTVCVHGGLGHAYATYVLEAECHGFAAIAFDTEGFKNTTGGCGAPYREDEEAYVKDCCGHKEKDSFATEFEPLENQWLYWAVADTVIANSVMRAEKGIDGVGLTGLSWGGVVTSTTVAYDRRFAFCVPVYIAFHMASTTGSSLGLTGRPFASALWQEPKLLNESTVPVLMLASDRDHFASVDTCMKTADDLPNGSIIIKPDFPHSHGAGACPSEIYRYGMTVIGKAEGFIEPERRPLSSDGRSYSLKLSVPTDIKDVAVNLYTRTEPILPYGFDDRPEWNKILFSYNDETKTVKVIIPADVYMYYLTFTGICEELIEVKKDTPYLSHDPYGEGTLISSSEVIVLGDGDITQKN
ncbi:MAG: alpha/beta hydrolase [Eubacteriales bacterium]